MIHYLRLRLRLFSTIEELGKNLSSIQLSIAADCCCSIMVTFDSIIRGCPKLKTLTLESALDCFPPYYMNVSKESLEALGECCTELKDLKITNVWFKDIFTEEEIEEILPNCDVEIKECEFEEKDDSDEGWNPYGITMILMILIIIIILVNYPPAMRENI